jgi:hypothetical protein
MIESVYNEAEIKELYERVVEKPNKNNHKRGFVKCPECEEEILMIPTLRVMSEAIENHIQKHKELLAADLIRAHQVAIHVRLSLMSQVLQQACNLQIS